MPKSRKPAEPGRRDASFRVGIRRASFPVFALLAFLSGDVAADPMQPGHGSVGGAKVLEGEVERLSPETFLLEAVFSQALTVPYGKVIALCGDLDGCRVRMTMFTENGFTVDEWTFVIRSDDSWTARPSGGITSNNGNVSNTSDEIIFEALVGSDNCQFRDDTHFDFILIRRFALQAVSPDTVFSTCVLKIED